MENTAKGVPIKVAAKLLGMSELSIRGCLINKALPIGGAWKNEGSNCWKYYVSPKQLSDYSGIPLENIIEMANGG